MAGAGLGFGFALGFGAVGVFFFCTTWDGGFAFFAAAGLAFTAAGALLLLPSVWYLPERNTMGRARRAAHPVGLPDGGKRGKQERTATKRR